MSRYRFFCSLISLIFLINLPIATLIIDHAVPHLFYEGYIYDGYLFALVLVLQLIIIEDAITLIQTNLQKGEN